MVTLIDELERLGLVERRTSPTDRRTYHVTLTSQGQVVLAQASEQAEIAESEFLTPLTAAEREQLRTFLQRLNEQR